MTALKLISRGMFAVLLYVLPAAAQTAVQMTPAEEEISQIFSHLNTKIDSLLKVNLEKLPGALVEFRTTGSSMAGVYLKSIDTSTGVARLCSGELVPSTGTFAVYTKECAADSFSGHYEVLNKNILPQARASTLRDLQIILSNKNASRISNEMARQLNNANLTGIFATARLSFFNPDMNGSIFDLSFVVHGSGSLSRVNGEYKQGYRRCFVVATVQDEEALGVDGKMQKTRVAKLNRPICEIAR